MATEPPEPSVPPEQPVPPTQPGQPVKAPPEIVPPAPNIDRPDPAPGGLPDVQPGTPSA